MKKLLMLLAILPVVLLFYGCPLGLDYPAGNPGSEKIDSDLIGTWVQNDTEKEIVSVTISKNDKHSYKVHVNTRGSLYALETDDLEAWVTEIGGKKFLFAKPEGETQYYLYSYEVKGKKLTTYDVSLLDGGIDAVTSTESLRKQIQTSLGMEGGLSEQTDWTKE